MSFVVFLVVAAPLQLTLGEAPAGCPTADELRQQIEARVSGDLSGSAAAISIREEHPGLVAEFDYSGGPLRRIESKKGDCAELGRAIVLVLALALERDTEVVRRRVLAASVPVSTSEPLLLQPRLGARSLALAGALPSIGLGAELFGELVLTRLMRIDLGLRILGSLPSRLTARDVDGLIIAAHASFCGGPRRVMFCATVAAGGARSRLIATDAASQVTPWVALGARVDFTLWSSPPLQLRLSPEAAVPVVRTSIAIDSQPVWTSAPFAGGASIALVFGP